MALDGNDLYMSESENQTGQLGRILKIDVTDSNPIPIEVVTNLYFPIGLELIGSELFFTDWTESANGTDTLNKIDLTATNPEVITILNSLNFPSYLTYANGELYISQNDRVSKIPEQQLGVKEINKLEVLEFYPNPTEGLINFNKLSGTNEYVIFDALGNKIHFGKFENIIDVNTLRLGLYFIKINKTISKFIKK